VSTVPSGSTAGRSARHAPPTLPNTRSVPAATTHAESPRSGRTSR
jgi:hypothetical protein